MMDMQVRCSFFLHASKNFYDSDVLHEKWAGVSFQNHQLGKLLSLVVRSMFNQKWIISTKVMPRKPRLKGATFLKRNFYVFCIVGSDDGWSGNCWYDIQIYVVPFFRWCARRFVAVKVSTKMEQGKFKNFSLGKTSALVVVLTDC